MHADEVKVRLIELNNERKEIAGALTALFDEEYAIKRECTHSKVDGSSSLILNCPGRASPICTGCQRIVRLNPL